MNPRSADKPDSPPVIGAEIDYDKFLDCVHCGLCTSACPTYLETGDENNSPRGRIYLMRGVVDGRLKLTESVSRHLNLCLDCRSCETACPSGVQYGRLIEPFRVDMKRHADHVPESKTESTPEWFRKWILLGLFPHAKRMRQILWSVRIMQRIGLIGLIEKLGLVKLLPMALQRMYRMLPELGPAKKPLPEFLPAKGYRRAKVALFTGCVSETMSPETNRATARVLQENGCDVVIPHLQGCCGAIHYHSGDVDPALNMAMKNVAAFRLEDIDAVIVNAAGCGAILKDYGHIADEAPGRSQDRCDQLSAFSGRVKDVSEFLVELGIRPPGNPLSIRVTYHDACHLVHAQRIATPPRELLATIPELEVIPLAESTICCGAAGSYNLIEPEMADRLLNRKLDCLQKADSEIIVTGNIGCSLQIQAGCKERKLPMQVRHPVELLDLAYRGKSFAESNDER